jgi:hypothetical protein
MGGVGQQLADAGEVLPHGTPEARLGLSVGMIVGGIAITAGGITGELFGGAATVTGIGAAVGVPAMVVSTTLVVGGAGNISAGIRGLMTTGSGSTGPQGLGGRDFEKWLHKELNATKPNFKAGGREFDGAVGSRWIEAKSGRYWMDHAQPGPGFEKFKSDIGAKLRIAKDNGATLEVHSNSSIPEHVKEWLTKKGVSFFEH